MTITWPVGSIGIPDPEDYDIREYAWVEVEPFETAFRPAVMLGGHPREEGADDGDTWDMAVDLGLDVRGVTVTVRLIGWECGIRNPTLGVNAYETILRGATTPEMKQRGLLAKDRVNELLPVGGSCLFRSRVGGKRGSLGRWLALTLVPTDRSVPPEEAKWVSVGDLLMAEGFATVWWRGWNRGRPRPE